MNAKFIIVIYSTTVWEDKLITKTDSSRLPTLTTKLSLAAQSTYIYRVQSCVWRLTNYWPPTPLSTQRVCPPPAAKANGSTLAGRWGGGGSIVRKTPDIGFASYSIIPLRVPETTWWLLISKWLSTILFNKIVLSTLLWLLLLYIYLGSSVCHPVIFLSSCLS